MDFVNNRTECDLIHKIAKRAVCLAVELDIDGITLMDTDMDVSACHANGNPLDLSALLAAKDGDFGHDVFGIRRFIDRKTGKLGGCFSPRYSRRASVKA